VLGCYYCLIGVKYYSKLGINDQKVCVDPEHKTSALFQALNSSAMVRAETFKWRCNRWKYLAISFVDLKTAPSKNLRALLIMQ